MRIKHPHMRVATGLLLAIALVLLVAFNSLFVWVASGPRTLEQFTPMIESALSGDNYQVKIGQTMLHWDGITHPIDIRLHDVSVLTGEGQEFSRFQEIAVGVHIPSLLLGRILPTSFAINRPVISLVQNEDRSINFGFRRADAAPEPTLPFAALIAPLLNPQDNDRLRKLRSIRILDADVSIGNAATGTFFEATHTDFVAKRRRGGVIELLVGAKIRYDGYLSTLNSNFRITKKSPTIDGVVDFRGVELSSLSRLFTHLPQAMPLNMPISGSTSISISKSGEVERVKFIVDGGIGRIETDQLPAPLAVSWAHAEGEVSNNLSDIRIDKLTADLEGMLLSAKGTVSLTADDVAAQVEASIKDVPGAKVANLWPPALAPLTREWVTTNISNGKVSEAKVKTNIQPGDLKKPILPKEAIDASIALEGATIKYLPEHPPVEKVKSIIRVDGMALDAAIESADFLRDTKISNGRVLIEDLNPDNPFIKINFDAATSAREVVKFLGLPRLKHAERLGLKEEGTSGNLNGTAALGFYFFAPKDENGKEASEPDIDYQVSAEMRDIATDGFMKKFDIKNASGSFSIDNKGLLFKGAGNVNGATASAAEVKYVFTPEAGLDTFIDVTATAPAESLPRFGYPAFEFLQGNLGVKANVKLGDALEISQASINLTDAAVNATKIGWKKAAGEAANLDIAADKKDGAVAITAFHLTAKDIDAKGSAGLNKDLSAVNRLSMNTFKLGETDLDVLNYEPMGDGFKLTVSGKTLDLRGYMAADADKESSFSFEHFPSVEFSGDITTVMMTEDSGIANLKGTLSCGANICDSANISGVTGGEPFSFRILRNPKGKRQLSLRAQNAGAFLHTIGIYDNMEGGDLTITGNYDDGAKDSVLRGRLDINENTIRKAPILTRILSLASLTGFLDTLQGNGIRFTKVAILFSLQNDVITLTKARAYGSAIGLTAEGTVTLPKVLFDLKGTVVPSYTANTVLGKLPIVGAILTGGEGQGVFAARYAVRGTDKEPDVSVNPLSMLTPGFLRGIFDAGDIESGKGVEE